MARALLLAAVLVMSLARAAAAGDVQLTIKSNVMIVKGTDDADRITVDAPAIGAGNFRFTPGAGTTVNGFAAAEVFGGLEAGGSVKILLGDGDDELTLETLDFTGPVTIKTGKGSDHLRIGDARLTGPTKIDLGGGDDGLRFCAATLTGDVTVKLGKGTGAGVLEDCGTGNSVSTQGGSVVLLDQSTAGGAFTIKGAAGPHVVGYNRTPTAGAVTIKNVGLAALCYGTVGGPVTFAMAKLAGPTGSITCLGGTFSAAAQGQTAVVLTTVTVAGPLTAKFGGGGDGLTLVDVLVDGKTTASLGNGNNFLGVGSVTITGDLVVKAGKGDDTLEATDFLVNGDGAIKYGDGANSVAFAVTKFDHDLTVKTGKGDDFINTSGAVVGGLADVDAGKGVNTVMTN